MRSPLPEPVARGRTAEIYPWEPGTVLKLYYERDSEAWVAREVRATQAVREAGMPAPAIGEVVRVDGRSGLVLERIEGESMLGELARRPWRLFELARMLAELQARFNQVEVQDLPSFKTQLRETIETSEWVPDELRRYALAALDRLPDGTVLCHGDFHPDNVLLTAGGPVIIDWNTGSAGNPWADVARTSVILRVGARAAETVHPLLRAGSRLFQRVYLNHYRSLYTDRTNLLGRWLPILATARLHENIAGERALLLKLARRLEGGIQD